jgi:putative ABC transport system permease protein
MVLFARARAESGLKLDEALDLTRIALRNRFKARPGKPDNFDSITPDSIREFIGRIMGLIGAAVVPITCISLVVGGIVIMNIMLAAVTERTHEIGIRKSLGARRRDILNQFLVESSFLAAAGGLIGVVLAWFIAVLVRNTTSVPMVLPWTSILIGVGLSAVVGLTFGIYPARRAAKLDPIEALRVER